MAQMTERASFKKIMRRWQEMKAIRLPREAEWQQIADYFLPRKNFNVETVKGGTIPRKVMTTVPQRALGLFASLLVGYLADPTRPFLKPNVTQGLISARRSKVIDREAADYLDDLAWSVFDRFMLAKAGGYKMLNAMGLELGAFGTAIGWVGHKRGFGPRYMTRPLRACWIDVDDEDVVNTVYYEFCLSLEEVFRRYPDGAKANVKLGELYREEKNWGKKIRLLHCVEPRHGGEVDAIASRKPYAETVIAHEYEGAVLAEGGYDTFPYAVPRLGSVEGSPYGQGLAWVALPAAIALNRLQDIIEYGVGAQAAPQLFVASRLFKKPSRELGAFNYFDPKLLGFSRLTDLVQAMPTGANPLTAVQYMDILERWVKEPFNIDWVQLRESGNVTATEIDYRKRLNLTGSTGLLVSVDRDLMVVIGDRTLEIMIKENMVDAPPESLAGVHVDWDFAGPIAIAQQMNQVDAIDRLMVMAQQAAAVDADSVAILALEEGLRLAAEALGAPPTVTRSRVDYDNIIQLRQQQRQEDRDAQNAQLAAQAVRDAGQGAATMANAGTGAGAGGQPMAMAA